MYIGVEWLWVIIILAAICIGGMKYERWHWRRFYRRTMGKDPDDDC
jgi:hypothetical protein